MLADFLLTAYELRWFLLGCGVLLVTLGVAAIVMRRTELVLGPDPVIPPVRQSPTFTVPSPPAPPNYRRPDSDTGVVPRIPGATRGPVCPVCGGPWHALCLSAPKERSEETVVLIPPVADLAAQYAALGRFFKTVDETRADTDQAMGRLVDDLAGRDDCPLTTQEIVVPDATETPVHRAIADREPTQELSKTVAKILEAKR